MTNYALFASATDRLAESFKTGARGPGPAPGRGQFFGESILEIGRQCELRPQFLEDTAILVTHAGIHFRHQTNQSAVDGLGKRNTS